MNNVRKLWEYLIFILLIVKIATSVWEIAQ
jgi:hypothetical protein